MLTSQSSQIRRPFWWTRQPHKPHRVGDPGLGETRSDGRAQSSSDWIRARERPAIMALCAAVAALMASIRFEDSAVSPSTNSPGVHGQGVM